MKNAQGILKNRAKGGRKLVEAIARACGACRRIALGMDKAGDVHGATRNKIASAAKPSTSDPLLERVRGALMEKKRDGRETDGFYADVPRLLATQVY